MSTTKSDLRRDVIQQVDRATGLPGLFATPEEGHLLIRAFANIRDASTREAAIKIISALASSARGGQHTPKKNDYIH